MQRIRPQVRHSTCHQAGATQPSARRAAVRSDPKRWLLPVLAFAVPLVCSPLFGDSFERPKLIVLELGLALALLAMAQRDDVSLPPVAQLASLCAIIFLLISVAATAASVAPSVSLIGNYEHDQGLITLFVLVAYFFFATAWIRNDESFTGLAAGWVLAATCNSMYGIAQQLGFDPLGWPIPDDGRTALGGLGNPNSLAEFLALSVPITVWLAWRLRGLGRDLTLWTLPVQIAALLLTQTRTAWLAVATQVGLAVMVLLCRRWRRTRSLIGPVIAVPLLGLVAAFVTLLVLPAFGEGVDTATSRVVQRGQPISERQYLWRSTVQLVASRPLIGWGPDSFELAYPAYRSTDLDQLDGSVGRDDAPHNTWLRLASSAGLSGLAAFLLLELAVIGLLVRRLVSSNLAATRGHPATAVALLSVSITYFVLFTFGESRITTEWVAWVIAGCSVGIFGRQNNVRIIPLPPLIRALPVVLGTLFILDVASAASADLAYGQAVDTLGRGASSKAVQWLELATRLRPFEPVYHQQLADGLMSLGQPTNDASLLQSAVEQLRMASYWSGGRDSYVLADLAQAVLAEQQALPNVSEQPSDYMNAAIRLDPLNPLLYTQAARLAIELQKPDQARLFWEAAKLRSHSPDALESLGLVALRLGDTAAARTLLKQAAEQQWRPRLQASYYRTWGRAALADQVPNEAVAALEQALSREPNSADIRSELAEAQAARRDSGAGA